MTGYAFGAFVEPLEAEFGWSRTEINAALPLSVFSGLVAPISGRLMDRHGARPVMVASLLLISLGLLLRAGTSELWHFYFFTAISSIGMPGATIGNVQQPMASGGMSVVIPVVMHVSMTVVVPESFSSIVTPLIPVVSFEVITPSQFSSQMTQTTMSHGATVTQR